MYSYRKIKDDIYMIGASDRRLALFENVYPIKDGVSYNSYFVDDEKTVVLDTVDKSVSGVFFENIKHLLNGRQLDYLIVNHMEPDHCAMIAETVLRYPDVKVVGNAKTFTMIENFFGKINKDKFVTVSEGDELCTGKHTFTFVMAPMVHWPEVMVTYDKTDKILFSADAFGSFGALDGNIFADEIDYGNSRIDEARRYYTNIVGKYGAQVQALLKKASTLEIQMICPLHGHIFRKDFGFILEKYDLWSRYEPEEKAVVIAYASIYGNTENAVSVLANMIADKGVKNIKVYDVSVTDPSFVLSECFRASHLVFASSTYNGGIFPKMETLLLEIKAHALQNRKAYILDNGSWGAVAGRKMEEILTSLKGFETDEEKVSLKSSLKEEQLERLQNLAEKISSELR